jgi:aryl-alcohol dehydrogenase-like predicted oxidoreductase
VAQIERAGKAATIVSVHNLYNLASRRAGPTLEYCEREGLAFIRWFPMGGGQLTRPAGAVRAAAPELDATQRTSRRRRCGFPASSTVPAPAGRRLRRESARRRENAGDVRLFHGRAPDPSRRPAAAGY